MRKLLTGRNVSIACYLPIYALAVAVSPSVVPIAQEVNVELVGALRKRCC